MTPQQRAAKITYHLCLRALAGLPGLSTRQIAVMLGLKNHSAKALMYNISGRGVPVYDDKDIWEMDAGHLERAVR